MDYREIKYPSSDGKSTIYGYIWEPSEETKTIGVLQISHGMAEHARRYEEFAKFLTSKGFVVCANDHLGHGQSANGVFGYMSEKNGHKTLVKDVYKLFNIMKKDYSDIPYILYGHSMGSFIARYACSLWGMEFDGAIFSGTTGGEHFDMTASNFFGFIGKIFGYDKESKLGRFCMNKLVNKKCRGQKSKDSWLSTDKHEVEMYRQDPHCGFSLTHGGYRDLMRLISIVSSKQWAMRIPKNLPIYLFSGLEDPIGHFGRGVIKVYERLVNAGCEDVEIKLYENARHEMLFERNKKEVYEDVYDWIMESVIKE